VTGLDSHVLLVGFMGAGKSSVGRMLASRLGVPFVDLDELIAEEAGQPIPEIFADEGEDGFRDRESAALESLVAVVPSVVACGGGIVGRETNRPQLGQLGTVVYLAVSPEESARRCGVGEDRPMLAGRSANDLASLLALREPLYAAAADVRVDTDGLRAEAVADLVEHALHASRSVAPAQAETKEHE
jgi:shikimate kinase